eukprot:TRINITY_DN67174_c5_g3_i1.p1 TRINITY_DN67174_c5_g3~~TRINITY_DN67174_c5_g3_i1.p1  ORF type:complete len:650 (+),score=379.44 TRINITY_DN67174_c5_g3_i1:134-2083(+)
MMFEDIHEIAENSAYLKAVEEKDVSLQMLEQLPPYEECAELEQKLKDEGLINFETVFHEPTGYYMIRCFLVSDYAGDKAIFIKDVETYKSIRFESARRRVASVLFDRFVSESPSKSYPKGSSVFDIVDSNTGDGNGTGAAGDEKNDNPPPLDIGPSRSANGKGDVHGVRHPNTVNDDSTQVRGNSSAGGGRGGGGANSGGAAESGTSGGAMLHIGDTNTIGVYGQSVQQVEEHIRRGEAPASLFDEVMDEVMQDLNHDVFPRFLKSPFYRKYIRTKAIETRPVAVKDFTTFRVLGRGGFGSVHACRKTNSGTLYAMKCVNKKLVKVKAALTNIMEERDVLTMVSSPFVTNLKYALQDENTLYLIMDLMLGGDLKFHLINAGRFSLERARFYAAEVLLGLEHLHSLNIIYRDLKLENVLLDHEGHCRVSDLGLAVVTKSKIKGYAGTPGYTAPEMIRNRPYGPEADLFSFGVLLYRMLCGSKPFKGKIDRDLDKAVVELEPKFPRNIFTPEATDLLKGVLQKRPENRLGAGPDGIQDIKDHPFFAVIDWGLLEAGYLEPPFKPNKMDVNAASLKDIGDFDMNRYRNVRLSERFKKTVKRFDYVSRRALQKEMVNVLEKADKNVNYEKFSMKKPDSKDSAPSSNSKCCVIF